MTTSVEACFSRPPRPSGDATLVAIESFDFDVDANGVDANDAGAADGDGDGDGDGVADPCTGNGGDALARRAGSCGGGAGGDRGRRLGSRSRSRSTRPLGLGWSAGVEVRALQGGAPSSPREPQALGCCGDNDSNNDAPAVAGLCGGDPGRAATSAQPAPTAPMGGLGADSGPAAAAAEAAACVVNCVPAMRARTRGCAWARSRASDSMSGTVAV